MTTAGDYKGTITIKKNDRSKEMIADMCKGLFEHFIVAEETATNGEGEPYEHIHIGYYTPHKPDEARIRDILGAAYISQHRSSGNRRAVAWYVTKEDIAPIVHNWPTWKMDAQNGKSDAGQGIRKAKAEAAWNKDVPTMKTLGMMPNEVNRNLQAVEPVQEEEKAQKYVNLPQMDIEFQDYRTKKVVKFEVQFPGQLLKTTRKGKELQFKGRRGVWLYGPSRCGKTYQTRELIKKYEGYECSDVENWSGYNQNQLIFINDVRSGMFADPSEMRSFLDSPCKNRKYGEKKTDPNNTFYIFTCNYSLREFWNACLGENARRYSKWIDPLLNVLVEVELRGHYLEEGIITYGTAKFNLADSESEESESEEITRKKRLRNTEEDYCEKRIKLGDPNVRKIDEGYEEIIELDEVHRIVRVLENGEWRIKAKIANNQL